MPFYLAIEALLQGNRRSITALFAVFFMLFQSPTADYQQLTKMLFLREFEDEGKVAGKYRATEDE